MGENYLFSGRVGHNSAGYINRLFCEETNFVTRGTNKEGRTAVPAPVGREMLALISSIFGSGVHFLYFYCLRIPKFGAPSYPWNQPKM